MGTTPTLTPQNAEQILRECPAVSDVAAVVRARCPGGLRQQELGADVHLRHQPLVPRRPRLGEARRRRTPSPSTTSGTAAKVCLVGETLVREVFGGQSPLGKELRMQNVSLPRDRRAGKERGQHDGHRPGRHRPGPLDDDQVPGLRHHAHQHQPERAAAAAAAVDGGQHAHAISIPAPTALYSTAATRAGRPAPAGPLRQRRP